MFSCVHTSVFPFSFYYHLMFSTKTDKQSASSYNPFLHFLWDYHCSPLLVRVPGVRGVFISECHEIPYFIFPAVLETGHPRAIVMTRRVELRNEGLPIETSTRELSYVLVLSNIRQGNRMYVRVRACVCACVRMCISECARGCTHVSLLLRRDEDEDSYATLILITQQALLIY